MGPPGWAPGRTVGRTFLSTGARRCSAAAGAITPARARWLLSARSRPLSLDDRTNTAVGMTAGQRFAAARVGSEILIRPSASPRPLIERVVWTAPRSVDKV